MRRSGGVHEEGWRVEGCMRRVESEGMHEEGWRVKESMRRVKHSGRSVFPHDQNCCYDTAGGLDL